MSGELNGPNAETEVIVDDAEGGSGAELVASCGMMEYVAGFKGEVAGRLAAECRVDGTGSTSGVCAQENEVATQQGEMKRPNARAPM